MSADNYLKEAVKNVRECLAKDGITLQPHKNLFPSNYKPELDVTDELIGILQWAVDLGHIDMYLEMALLSQHLALP